MPDTVAPAAGPARFPCDQCGAMLTYAVGTDHLQCSYCGFQRPIPQSPNPAEERDYRKTLERLARESPTEAVLSIHCGNCAATYTLAPDTHAGECPFCGTPVVTATGDIRRIEPWALLPFSIGQGPAQEHFRRWLGRLWFAPGKLRQYARSDRKLMGMYLPYWTYDSRTVTRYQGMRGTVYYVTQTYGTVVNGRQVLRTRRVPKVRWHHVSGDVNRFFDDVLVAASSSLPEPVLQRLRGWDLAYLRAYRDEYLSGFRSEVYQVPLEGGFASAREHMDAVIQGDIRRAIGGDRQRILNHDTVHRDITFKHILLPVWLAAFQYRGKTYRFVVNGRTGEVQGERPYSPWKIAVAVAAAGALLALLVLAAGDRIDWGSLLYQTLQGGLTY